MFLIDANIFLAVLLNEKKDAVCKDFLSTNRGKLYISDFAFHSIGVVLLRLGKHEVFGKFLEDALPQLSLVTLPIDGYKEIPKVKDQKGLDFDDAYQYLIAKHNNLSLVTLDRDFLKIDDIKVKFL